MRDEIGRADRNVYQSTTDRPYFGDHPLPIANNSRAKVFALEKEFPNDQVRRRGAGDPSSQIDFDL